MQLRNNFCLANCGAMIFLNARRLIGVVFTSAMLAMAMSPSAIWAESTQVNPPLPQGYSSDLTAEEIRLYTEGRICASKRDARKAVEYYLKVAESAARRLPEENFTLFHLRYDIIFICIRIGKYEVMEKWLLAQHRMIMSANGADDVMKFILNAQMVQMYDAQHQLEKATPHAQQALKLISKDEVSAAARHLPSAGYKEDFGVGLMWIAQHCNLTGLKAEAEVHFNNSVSYLAEETGPESFLTGRAKIMQSEFYNQLPDLKKEAPLLADGLRILERELGKTHLDPLRVRVMKGRNHLGQYQYTEAEETLRTALNSLRTYHPDVTEEITSAENLLANLLEATGRRKEAAELYKSSVHAGNGSEKKASPFQKSTLLHNLGLQEMANDNLRNAEVHLEESLRTYSPENYHINTQSRHATLDNLIQVKLMLGKKDDARAIATKLIKQTNSLLVNLFTFNTNDWSDHWSRLQMSSDYAILLGMADESAKLSLRTKSLAVEGMMEARTLSRLAPETRSGSIATELLAVRAQLRGLRDASTRDFPAISKMEAEEDALQDRLRKEGVAAGAVRNALNLEVSELNTALPKDSVFIDYISYGHLEVRKFKKHRRYAAAVHRPGKQVKLIPLAHTGAEIDELVDVFVGAMQKPGENSKEKSAALESLMIGLHKTLVGPLEAELEGAKTLIICPDNCLNFLPFATLIDSRGRFLCERFDLRLVNSAREILSARKSSENYDNKAFVIFGGAKYRLTQQAEEAGSGKMDPGIMDDMTQNRSVFLKSLPGTSLELDTLKAEPQKLGWTCADHTDESFTERELRKVHGPDILHISAYGYVMNRLPGERTEPLTTLEQSYDPKKGQLPPQLTFMERSGLMLSGAENTIDAWKARAHIDAENNGILTAREAADLDLNGTWIATLSGCDTGMGAALSGKHVQDLQKAFSHAGAQHVMLSLWPVYDDPGVRFLAEFYKQCITSGEAPKALNELQRKWLPRVKREADLWQAIKQAGGFVLTGL